MRFCMVLRSSTQPARTPDTVRSPNPRGGVCVMRMSVSLGMRFHLLRISWPRGRLNAHRQNLKGKNEKNLLKFQLATYSGCHGVPQKFNPKSFTPLSSKYVQFVKYWRIFCVFTADLRASRVFPSVGISSRRPVLCLQWLPPDGEKLLKFGSKESSWLPAMTSLCLKSCSPSHRLKVSTSSSSPQALKSPAWIKISPLGMSNLK